MCRLLSPFVLTPLPVRPRGGPRLRSRVKRRRRQVRSNGVRTSRREIAQIPSCNHGISVVRVLTDPETIRRLVGWIAGEVFCKVVKVLYSTAQYFPGRCQPPSREYSEAQSPDEVALRPPSASIRRAARPCGRARVRRLARGKCLRR